MGSSKTSQGEEQKGKHSVQICLSRFKRELVMQDKDEKVMPRSTAQKSVVATGGRGKRMKLKAVLQQTEVE